MNMSRICGRLAFVGVFLVCAGLVLEATESTAQTCSSGCIKGKRRSLVVPPRGAVGIRSSRQFIERSDARSFRSSSDARAAGFTDYIPPTATPTPTPTTTPAIPSYVGRYTTSDSALLEMAASVPTCNPTVFPQATAVSMDLVVFHEADETIVRAEEPSTYPTPAGTPTPAPPGARYWGGIFEGGFLVADTFATQDNCGSPIRNREFAFSEITDTDATVTRTDRLVCQSNNPVIDCQQVWTGTVNRAQ
jgi:hypothetical protein